MKSLLPFLAAVLLAGCSDYPRDVEGTLDRVRAERIIRVGLVAGTPRSERLDAFLAALGRASGARPHIVSGSAETLFPRLDDGALDLVIGEFGEASPWVDEVAIIEPLVAGEPALGPAARNGENRWIMLVEKVVRDQSAAG